MGEGKTQVLWKEKHRKEKPRGFFLPFSTFLQKIQRVAKNPKNRFFVETNTFNNLEKDF